MRALTLVVVVLIAAPVGANGGETLRSYVDASGHFRAGLVALGVGAPDDGAPVPPAGVGAIDLARFTFAAHPCHPKLQVLLDYTPDNATLDAPEASVTIPFEFQAELFDATSGTRLPGATHAFHAPGEWDYALPAAVARTVPLRADLYMTLGAESDWTFRVRGWLDGEQCVVLSEVEANPDGTDAGHEWVELQNLGFGSVDLSGWTIRALHGTPQALTLPTGTAIDGGARLVVNFTGQFLDNADEVVVLDAPDGAEYSRTPPLWDAADDARTHQLAAGSDDSWDFAVGTPGEP